jgi:hypothetical protein
MVEPTGEYVSHAMKELGRLGLKIHDIERRDNVVPLRGSED